jgi:DNA-binding CsgD family transcriptional regulator
LEDGYALIPKYKFENTFLRNNIFSPLLSELKAQSKDGKTVILNWVNNGKTEGVEIPPSGYNLSVKFGFPSFESGVLFRFRLIGWQDNWSSWQVLRSLNWNNLSPGDYILEIQANVSPKKLRVPIFVLPQWYQTVFFKVGMIFLSISLLFFLLKTYLKSIEIRHQKQIKKKEFELEQQVVKAKNEQLEADNLNKSRELANATFTLIHKNESLLSVKEELDIMKSESSSKLFDGHYKKLISILDNQLENEKDWQIFESNFNEVHDIFFKKLKHQFPDLTPGDLKLAAYLKMNLSSKEIAPLLNISIRGVENKRYRLRKKMNLEEDDNLTNFMIDY